MVLRRLFCQKIILFIPSYPRHKISTPCLAIASWKHGHPNTPVLCSEACLSGMPYLVQLATSRMASVNACGASCGKLCPIPPVMVWCAYFPLKRTA